MSLFTKISAAGEKVAGMAERMGLGAEASEAQALELARNYRSAVVRCSGCGQSESCGQWQQDHAHAETPPSYCRNKAMFDGLRR